MKGEEKNILNSIKNQGTGFNLPKGYFDKLEEKVLSDQVQNDQNREQTNSEREKKGDTEPAGLDLIGKNHGFKVPEKYFEDKTIENGITGSAKVISLAKKNIGKWISLSVAASLLIVFGLGFYITGDKSIELAEVNNEEIENWIDTGLVSFNSYEIAEAFNDVDFENDLYTDEEVADYLDHTDIEQLILDN